MTVIQNLIGNSFPAVLIERWAGVDGWPCYRIVLCLAPDLDPISDELEYETYAQAHDAAETFGATMLPGGFHILDMTKETGA